MDNVKVLTMKLLNKPYRCILLIIFMSIAMVIINQCKLNAQMFNLETKNMYIIDNSPNTITKLLPITKLDGISYPVIIYDSTKEKEIIYFLQQLKISPETILFVETTIASIPDEFKSRLERLFASDIQRKAVNQYNEDTWINRNPKSLVITDRQTDLTPYAIQFSVLKHIPIANSDSDIDWFVSRISTIDTLVYFGNDIAILNHLNALNKIIINIGMVDQAEQAIAKSGLTNNIITILPSVGVDSCAYWKPAVIYASERKTMLLTPADSTYDNYLTMDNEIEHDININIKPNNGGTYPDFMVIFGWDVISPYAEVYDEENSWEGYKCADSRYYGDIDGDHVPDIAVSRIAHLMNNITVTNLFATRGVFLICLKDHKKQFIKTEVLIIVTDLLNVG